MRSTGRSSGPKEKVLSIRLSPDGLSFWTTGVVKASHGERSDYFWDFGSASKEKSVALSRELAPAERIRSALGRCIGASGWSGGPVRILLDTLGTVLVPRELFDPAHVADYLAVNNIAVGPGEQAVVSQLGIEHSPVAVMICGRDAVDAVTAVFGDRAWFTSPFEMTDSGNYDVKFRKKDSGKEFAAIYLTEANAYMTVQTIPGGGWRYFEVLPYAGKADLLYYMQELAARFDIRRVPLCIGGSGAKKMTEALRKQFGR